ncbi:MAG: hypothetical protein MI750_00510 [Xanthomonadales bacterium]|nr:hypothetical protein [Xanthomonadales bacterium]
MDIYDADSSEGNLGEGIYNHQLDVDVEALEEFLVNAFVDLMPIGLSGGVSVKRMAHLLTAAQIKALDGQGFSRQEIMGESGFSAKTVRAWLRSEHTPTGDIVTRFAERWIEDSNFPNPIPIESSYYPSWIDLCDAHSGGEITSSALLLSMQKKKMVSVQKGLVRLCWSKVKSNNEASSVNIMRFIGDWSVDPGFPDVLPLSKEKDPSWFSLCQKYGNHNTESMQLLKRMEKSGVVEISQESVLLRKRDYLALTQNEAIKIASRALHSKLSTLKNNLFVNGVKHYERRVISQYILPEDMDELRLQLSELAEKTRDEAREIIRGFEQSSVSEQSIQNACGLGLYWFEDVVL